MSNYVLYYKTIDNTMYQSLVNADTNETLLEKEHAFDDNDDIAVYFRQTFTEIQSALPKGKKVSIELVELSDQVFTILE